jgi:hypothetical protein
MDEKKEQKIIVFTNLSATDKALILNGIKVTEIFKKELCLLYRLNKKERKTRDSIEKNLNEYLVPLKKEIPGLKTSVLVTDEKLNDLPEMLADDHEAILLIASSSEYKTYATAGTRSPVPFLFINPDSAVSSFQKIILPIDLRRENSDTALWCSWFGRFAKSQIIAVAANEKNSDSQQQVLQNVRLTKKLLQQTGVSHKIYKGKKSSFNNCFEAMNLALNSDTDLFILLGSSIITPIDWLIGLPERKIINKAGNLPVLLVNPRRDNYILCD